MNQTHTLRNLAAALLGRLRFIIICAVLSGMAAFCAVRFWAPFRYEAYASMYVRGGAAEDSEYASKPLADTCIVVLGSRSVMDEAAVRLVSALDEKALRAAFPGAGAENPPDLLPCVQISAVEGTDALKITANTRNPEASARICNLIMEIAPSRLARVVGAVSVETIDEAVPIYKPVSPNLPLAALVGLLAGFCFALLFALSLDFFDDTVRDAEKLSKAFSKPVLGEIQSADEKPERAFWNGFFPFGRRRSRQRNAPYRRDTEGRRSRRPRRKLITDENIPFNVVEGYKSIRTNLVFALGTAPRKTIVVSSAAPHEGKSTTAANIALAFSQISARVLLIDADMRKPVLHRTFAADNSAGLSTLIISLSTPENSIRRHVMGDLDLLPSGPLPPNPSELLASAHFQSLLETLSQRYDYIIIDTPPMNVVSDAVSIRGAGGVMLVARYAEATYEEIGKAMKKIALSGANMLGFALNDVERRPSRYYRYGRYGYYGYGYGYGYGRSRKRNDGDASKPADAPSANNRKSPPPGTGARRKSGREGV